MIGRWILPLVIGVELAGAAGAIVWRLNRPTPPQINPGRLDSSTARDLESLRQRAGNSADAWLEYGEACLAYGYFPESEASLRRAAQMDADRFEILYAWAYALQRLGRLEEAAGVFEQAVASAPSAMIDACWYHIGRCHLRTEDVDAAESAFSRASGFAPAKFQLARIYLRSGRIAESLEILDFLVDTFPDAIQPLLLKAAAERERGRLQSVREFSRRAERAISRLPLADHHQFLDPIRFRYGAARQIAEIAQLRGGGQQEDAARAYRQMMSALDLSDRRKLEPMLAAMELELGRPADAESLLLEHFEHAAVSPELLMQLGDAHAQQDRPQQALQIYERAVQMRPSAELHARLSRLYEQRSDSDLARHHAARAFCHQGIDSYRENQLQQAIPVLQEAVRLDQHQSIAWYYLGECLHAIGELGEARGAYQRCLEFDPLHGRAHAAMADLASSRGPGTASPR